jgi:Fe-S oxidoreductase
MRVGLFIPCYMDAFEPEVGVATLELLERLGCTVEYPVDQTCCGQPMTNTGCHREAAGAEALFVKNFSGYDFIVAPSGSCVHQVRVNMTTIEQTPEVPESGSVLFTETDLKVNTLAYLAQHLVVFLDERAIVPGLQDAYTHPVFRIARYAVFHTGPSATADIEGVLIHGAQGVRSLTLIVDG